MLSELIVNGVAELCEDSAGRVRQTPERTTTPASRWPANTKLTFCDRSILLKTDCIFK
jgi:hypothetical protein